MSNKEHPHAGLLRAIADGKTLQSYHTSTRGYGDMPDLSKLFIQLSENVVHDWRIKPDPPVDVVTLMFVEPTPALDNAFNQPNLKLTFDGETKGLKKAEILRYA